MRPQRVSLVTCLVLIAVLAVSSCNNETPTYLDPLYQIGAVEGYVLSAGEPRSVTVGAREFERPGRVIAKTRSRPDGWYRLELPVGRYRIEVDPGNFGFSSSDTSDVVRVEPRGKRHDLALGRLTIRIEAPQSMHGLWVQVNPRSTGRYVHTRLERTRIEGPTTEITFDLLVPSTFQILLTLAGSSDFWLPGTYEQSAAQQIAVKNNQETIVDADLSQYASISGSVVGSWQQAHTYGPNVEAYNADRRTVTRATVAADGTYQLHLLIAEPVKVLVVRYGGVEQWIGGDSFETATGFHPQPGDSLTGVDLVESGIQVHLEGPGSFLGHRPHFLITDGNGWEHELNGGSLGFPHTISNLLPGRYYLQVSHGCEDLAQPWKPQWYAGAQSLDLATPIDVATGQLHTITMQLEQGGGIEGQVLFGPPLWGVRVGIFDSSGAPVCEDFPGTENGKFRFAGLLDADYLIAVVNGDSRWWYPGTAELANAVAIRIANAQVVSGLIWSLEQP